ncbi:RNA ligase (ATP) [Pyxidicoccus xibeiensis]|uniref:RNA ligase (ATP) n=1 Tax=Pyxidicoccus xibeiensis TaxID=2906759 RepID=UPI0020A73A9A|nr:RNA ligase (ATP) [Pyxidicoccus xibeiensis]MCP3145274.1 RNA ligase (ATP) [Pyxidicoccus xibeiensis]
MERKLVSIQRIDHLEPIAGADNIVKARVMGWDVVVKKGEFSPGDACVFFEIDSLLPDGAPWAEFMRPRGFRVKTARLRGVLSQGLALPTSILPGAAPVTAQLGMDVRDLLGVVKFEPALPDGRDVLGPFPGQVPKTDEIRLQSALGVLDELRGEDLFVTTKLDGTSATFFRPLEGELMACSRNWALRKGDNAVWRMATKYGLDTVLPPGFAIQGELCGPGIQKNRLGLTEPDLFVFSVHDTRTGRFLGHAELVTFCAEHGLRTVPVEQVVTGEAAQAFDHGLEHYLKLAQGFYPGTKNRKEGIVVRPLVERPSPTLGGSRLSFKVINNDFLLKDED